MSTDGSTPAPTPDDADTHDTRLWILGAGDTVYVLHSLIVADTQDMVCTAANLDVRRWRMTPENWAQARALLEKGDDEFTIVDTERDGPEQVGGRFRAGG